jgi:Cytochrome C biogenesis protein
MKQHFAISSRLSTATANATRNATTCVRKLLSFLAILVIPTVLMPSTAAGNTSDARYNNLGHRMLCTCDSAPATGMGQRGCHQVLLECDHVNCDVSDRMRHELTAALQKDDKDDMILHSFVEKYGTIVLVAPPGMNKLVWMVAFAALAAVASIVVVVFVRKRQSRPGTVTGPLADLQGIDVDALRRRVRDETENDDS